MPDERKANPPADLSLAAAGDLDALSRVLPLIEDRVREIAAQVLRGDRAQRWVQASSLVQRAFLRLLDQRAVDFGDQARVTAVLATIMRRVVIDIARHETALRRGGDASRVALHQWGEAAERNGHAGRAGRGEAGGGGGGVDALEIEDALVALSAVAPDAARVAELRLWGGMEFEEIAVATDATPARVRALWNRAKAWLAREIGVRERGEEGKGGAG